MESQEFEKSEIIYGHPKLICSYTKVLAKTVKMWQGLSWSEMEKDGDAGDAVCEIFFQLC